MISDLIARIITGLGDGSFIGGISNALKSLVSALFG